MTTPATKILDFPRFNIRSEMEALVAEAEVERDVFQEIANASRQQETFVINWPCQECCCPTDEYGQHFAYNRDGSILNVFCDLHVPDFEEVGEYK